jgi:anti-sigma factor RsiW
MGEHRQKADDPIAAALRKAFADERPSDSMKQRLARSLRALPSSTTRTTPSWRGPAIAAAVTLLILVLGMIFWDVRKGQLADVPLKELQAFIDSNRSVDVATDDPSRVRAWLAQRVDFVPPPAARGDLEIELIGGRLCLFAGRRVASYMYRVRGHLLSIYVMTADGLTPTGSRRVERDGRTLTVIREGQLSQASWKENDLLYSVVGELSEPALLTTLDELRRQ